MEQRLTIVTIGVDALATMRDFYVEKCSAGHPRPRTRTACSSS